MKKMISIIFISLFSMSAFSLSLNGIKQFSYPENRGITSYFIMYDHRNLLFLQVGPRGLFSKNYYCEFFPLVDGRAQFGKKTVNFQNDKFGFINNTRYTYDTKKINLTLYTNCAGERVKPKHIRK